MYWLSPSGPPDSYEPQHIPEIDAAQRAPQLAGVARTALGGVGLYQECASGAGEKTHKNEDGKKRTKEDEDDRSRKRNRRTKTRLD